MATVDFFTGFTYKWAQTGNIFAWDDAQYKLGWATVGDTPPTVEQFNRVHQIADEKSNWLYGQLKTVADAKSVTLSAGSLTGLQQVLAAYGQSSTTDATLGRWMQVGAFGLGGVAPAHTDYGYPADFNLMDSRSGWVTVNASVLNGPSGASAAPYTGILICSLRNASAGASIRQEWIGYPGAANGSGSWIRYGTGSAGARTWSAWEEVYTSRSAPSATDTAKGLVELATTAETVTGTDTTRAVTPSGLAAAVGGFSPGRLTGFRIFDTVGTSTYTATAGTKAVLVEVIGGGGGGGGCPAPPAGFGAASSGGCGGSYSRKYITSGFSGVSVTVGAGGTATVNANGGNGGTSSFGSHCSAPGGGGGIRMDASNVFPSVVGSSTVTIGIGGDVNGSGTWAESSWILGPAASNINVGASGGSYFGGGVRITSDSAPIAGVTPGAGGSGVGRSQGTGALAGGAGAKGIVIVWEYA